MRRWLRENRWALALLVVLIPAAVYVALAPRFIPALLDDPSVRSAATGDRVEFAGAEFELTDLLLVPGDEVGAPEGRDVVVAAWRVDVKEPPEFGACRTFVVATLDGVPREWAAEGFVSIDVDFDDRFVESCSLDEAGEFELLQTYFVPAGELSAPAVEVRSASEPGSVLRFTE